MYILRVLDLPNSNYIVIWNEIGVLISKFIGFCQKKYAIRYCQRLLKSGKCFDIRLLGKDFNLIQEF